jgi:hypothetical protein
VADTYEYTDGGGSVHRVDSLDRVPKQYLKSMTVIGGEDEAPAAKKTSGSAYSSTGFDVKLPGVPKGFENLNPHYLVGALSIFLLWKNKNFMIRCVIVVFAFCYAFINFYSWFESSPYTQPGERIKKYNKPAVEQEQQEQPQEHR